MYRTHYAAAFADKGGAYTDYEPAYRYGYEVRTNERYRGRGLGCCGSRGTQ